MERLLLPQSIAPQPVVYSRVLSRNGRFELELADDTEAVTAIKRGFIYDGKKELYFTKSPEIAKAYLSTADGETLKAIRRHDLRIFLSKSTTGANLDIPITSGNRYLPFQEVGVTFALSRPIVLIGDDPGLGKTIQAIGVMNADPRIKRVLIICPSVVKTNWGRELKKFYIRYQGHGIVVEGEMPKNKDIVIVNYEQVAPELASLREAAKAKTQGPKTRYLRLAILRKALGEVPWDLLIIDESHYLQNSDAARTLGILGGGAGKTKCLPIYAPKILFLSGTPMTNRPENLWTIIKAADPDDLGKSWEYYGTRYCKMWKAPWGMDSSGAANLDELQNRLRGTFMIRRRKLDVINDLPPKKRQIVVLKAPPRLAELLKEETDLYAPQQSRLDVVIQTAEAAIATAKKLGDDETYKKDAKKLPGIMEVDFMELAKLRKLIAIEKIPHAIEYIRLMLEEHKKVVVFAFHREVITTIHEAFKKSMNAGILIGDQSEDARQSTIDKFQDDPDCRLIVANLAICIGFHLTAASYGLAIELDWRATVMSQAEDRLHRIGQKEEVLIQHLVFENSLDARQITTILEKQSVSDRAIG